MKKLTIFILLIAFITGVVLFWWNSNVLAVNKADKSQKSFVVSKGVGVRELANNLQEKGLIRNSVAFFLLVKQLGLDNKIQAGTYQLSPSMDARHIAEALIHGSQDVWITIPEGKRAEEIAAILKDNTQSYDDSWVKELKNNEGYLFPDTYSIQKDASIEAIITIMRDNFNKKFAEAMVNKSSTLSQNEIVTMASLIEREARFAEDRPLIASVLFNRLSKDMPLQIDATVQYVLGYQSQENSWWKKALSLDDLKIRSSYNTYLNTGLPPSPIANPGILAIEAVLSPAQTNYLYYISDSSGHNHYAKTLEEHDALIKKYGL